MPPFRPDRRHRRRHRRCLLNFRSAVGEDVGFGVMVYDGIVWSSLMAGIAPTPWWIMLAGAGGITLLAAAFYLIGVGLREALDPRTGSALRRPIRGRR